MPRQTKQAEPKNGSPKRASARKTAAKQASAELEEVAVETSVEGLVEAAEGADELEVAQGAVQVGVAAVAAAASDLTRGEDALRVSKRVAQLSEVVGAAGVADVAQGAEMLAASDDIETMAAIIGLLGVDDLERGLAVARISGELATVSEVVDRLGMPVLSGFLADRSDKLQDLAVDGLLRMGSMRALAEGMSASGAKISELGRNEVAEGAVRLAVADQAAEASDILAVAGAGLTLRGIGEAEVAAEAREVALDAVSDGIANVAAGAFALGEATAVDAAAQALKQ